MRAQREGSGHMNLRDLCWLATAIYALHVIEEFVFDWRGWARAVLKLPVEWSTFYVTNGAVIVLGVVSANLADAWPALALSFPALMLINAIFMHILPFLLKKGRFSPGLVTAVLLFLPCGFYCYRAVNLAGLLSSPTLLTSIAIGAGLMAFPIVCLKLSQRPYFKQA
jgi:Protein of unknown function with HXXEE motif